MQLLPVLEGCFVTVVERLVETKRNEDGPKLRVITQARILSTEPQSLLLPFNDFIIPFIWQGGYLNLSACFIKNVNII